MSTHNRKAKGKLVMEEALKHKEASSQGASQAAGRETLEILAEMADLLVRSLLINTLKPIILKDNKNRIPALIARHSHIVYFL